MDDSQLQLEVQKQLSDQQQKFTYYLIALCVTAIGFAVYKTSDQSLAYIHTILGFSVLSWGTSIYCGLMFLRYVMSNLHANNMYFEIRKGNHPEAGNNPIMIQAGVEGITEAMNQNGKRASRFSFWQYRFFLLGMILFICWHIFEMYLRSIC